MLSRIFVFERYGELVQLLQNSILAGAVLGIIGGFVGVFVMMRDHAFAVHGISEMSFAGAALALLLGYDVVDWLNGGLHCFGASYRHIGREKT